MDKYVNLVKLCVGAEAVDDLLAWQATSRGRWPDNLPRHVTRMWPKREAELLNGGSLYWVFKGLVLCRQRVLRLERVTGEDGIDRCAIVLDPEVIRTRALPRRPFQGWRYLAAGDAPEDLGEGRAQEDVLPPKLAAALADIGVR
ncbi:DUF1489 family protein [Marinibacterium sp. SX1]|uniref:DUF1489 family protein n=1 Tax=Marinibacterium sp. SX1 TaxID=3388424 RepID=UPI003D17EB51